MRIRHHRGAGPALLAALALMLAAACDSGDGTSAESATASPGQRQAAQSPTPTPNGIETQNVATILSRARAATQGLKAVRIHGRFSEDGEDIDLDFRYFGSSSIGELSVDGNRIAITRIGSTVYAKPGDRFLRSLGGQDAVRALSGKYIKTTPRDPDFKDIGDIASLRGFVTQLWPPKGVLSKNGTAVIAGGRAVRLSDDEGNHMLIATQGEPRTLRLEGGKNNRIDFETNVQPVNLQPPPADQVVDASEVEKLAGSGT